jgi:hypothetical protein
MPEGRRPAEWRSCVSVDPLIDRLKGAQLSRMEIVHLWVPGLASLRDTGLWSEYCVGLCRPWGCGPAEIVQGCAGLGWWVWPCRDPKCLKCSSHGDPVVLRCGSLGYHRPGGAKEQRQRIGDPTKACGTAAPWAYGVGFSVEHLLFF